LVNKGSNVFRLTKCYRTDTYDLFDAFENIRKGIFPKSSTHFQIHFAQNDKDINSIVGKLISCVNIDTTQFIAWQNKDVYKLNQWVQSQLIKKQKIGPAQFKGYYEGDRVVYTGENNKHECTNAMIGQVVKVTSRSMTINWDGKKESVYSDSTVDVSLAYCITVHKSQGSEYNNVVVPCYDVDKMMACLDRRWLYTAVTRAKQHISVIATQNIKEFVAEPLRNIPLHCI
jgi:ATP-dependent exoDNAse (exonuclease V) alpha subunit